MPYMTYENMDDMRTLLFETEMAMQMKSEYGNAARAQAIIRELRTHLKDVYDRIIALPEDEAKKAKEPDDLSAIRALAPGGVQKQPLPEDAELRRRMAGAAVGRFAGCMLGVPMENRSIADMEEWAHVNGDAFPPTDYWTQVPHPQQMHHGRTPNSNYTAGGMQAVGADDDISYTVLGLLMLEKYGFGITTENIGDYWREHLPLAFTAEAAALRNLKNGIPAAEAALKDNPYLEIIGADIRADGWAWACAGDPEKAAELAWRDAFLTHRRNGIYGEMYFAAAEAAAFVYDDLETVLAEGLKVIPAECAMAETVRWAMETASSVKNYRHARELVDGRFPGMCNAHTLNNAALTVFGLYMGQMDFTATVGNVIAMGLDNDCTGATAGSILGAMIGIDNIPAHWHCKWNDTVHTYIRGAETLQLKDMTDRFVRLAKLGRGQ